MRFYVWTIGALENANISAPPVYLRVKGVGAFVNGLNDLLAGPLPATAAWSTKMGYSFMGILSVNFVNAIYERISHLIDFVRDAAWRRPMLLGIRISTY